MNKLVFVKCNCPDTGNGECDCAASDIPVDQANLTQRLPEESLPSTVQEAVDILDRRQDDYLHLHEFGELTGSGSADFDLIQGAHDAMMASGEHRTLTFNGTAELDQTPTFDPGFYLLGVGRQESMLHVRDADAAVRWLGQDIGDKNDAGGGQRFGIAVSDPSQDGLVLEGTRSLRFEEITILSDAANSQNGGNAGVTMRPRYGVPGIDGASSDNNLIDFYVAGYSTGMLMENTGTGGEWVTRNRILQSTTQTCSTHVHLLGGASGAGTFSIDTNFIEVNPQTGQAGYRLEGNVARNTFDHTVIEGQGSVVIPIDCDPSTRFNRFHGFYDAPSCNLGPISNEFRTGRAARWFNGHHAGAFSWGTMNRLQTNYEPVGAGPVLLRVDEGVHGRWRLANNTVFNFSLGPLHDHVRHVVGLATDNRWPTMRFELNILKPTGTAWVPQFPQVTNWNNTAGVGVAPTTWPEGLTKVLFDMTLDPATGAVAVCDAIIVPQVSF